MNENTAAIADASAGQKQMPGDSGFWVLIGGDIFAFSVFFLTFAYYRMISGAEFYARADLVSVPLGALNTVILLTSSLIVAIGVHWYREGRNKAASRMLALGGASGIVFLLNKVIEWHHLFAEEVSFGTAEYFIYFFMFTGIHGVHVFLGLVTLFFISSHINKAADPPMRVRTVESAGIFWHLVDLLWVVLFALLYLLK